MAVLTDEIKEFIVKGLACYDTPTFLMDAVRDNFGIQITRQQVFEYDPRRAAQRWRDLHAATRAAFLSEASAISVTHKLVRLRMLDRLAHRCERNGVALALRALKEAAKECGGMYESGRSAVPQPVVVQLSAPPQPAIPSNGGGAVIDSTPFSDLSAAIVDAQPLNANRQ
jgi:hypothetical protein